jgi:hypothetical protein
MAISPPRPGAISHKRRASAGGRIDSTAAAAQITRKFSPDHVGAVTRIGVWRTAELMRWWQKGASLRAARRNPREPAPVAEIASFARNGGVGE